MRRYYWAFVITSVVLMGAPVLAQEGSPVIAEEPAVPEASGTRREAVFAAQNPNIVFIEGEDAVATNFNKEPILNYSCSSSRALQLNRTTGLQGGAAFFADYAFYLESAGTYELWYGGTPPAPLEEVYPAYTSPFSYSLDQGELVAVHREDVNVVGQYTPSYYWNRVGELSLQGGVHTLRFEVSEKRDADGRFFFYLDCFFLVKTEDGRRLAGEPLPEVFPKDLGDRSMDFPFRALEDYEILIRDNPNTAEPLVQTSLIHTLLSDYLSALKNLRRASALQPENLDLLLLQAKNTIWRGDIDGGLELYRKLLLQDPEREDLWNEAGKVAAWTSRYEDSISLYQAGLQNFPESLDLMVNLGLTYLWASREREAEETFTEARRLAGSDFASLKKLGEVYELNGYPERAASIFRDAIRIHPERLEAYLLLEHSLRHSGDPARAEKVYELIDASFLPSDELERRVALHRRRATLTDEAIARYEQALSENPDDLDLRGQLALTFFWNGLRDQGVREYENILANHAYRALAQMDLDGMDVLRLIDVSRLYLDHIAAVELSGLKKELADAQSEIKSARSAYETFQKKVSDAQAKGEPPPEPQGEHPRDVLSASEERLAQTLVRARSLAREHEALQAAYEERTRDRAQVRAREEEEHEVFLNVTKINQWVWDKRGLLQEMERFASRDQVLADYVVARVRQVEGELGAVQGDLEDLAQNSALLPARYAWLQGLVWNGQVKPAIEAIEALPAEARSTYWYLDDLAGFAGGLQPAASGVLPEDVQAAVEEALSAAESVAEEVRAREGEVREVLAELEQLLVRRLARTMYFFEENTYLLRRELGDFYMVQENLDGAIRQYRQALAIDPWDTGTVYRLGNAFELSGDWKQAMRSYERVYWDDPQYENAAGLYNQLARDHADSVMFDSAILADTSLIEYHGEAVYKTLFGSQVGLEARYEVDGVRLYKQQTGEDPSSYLTHLFSVGVPINLFRLGLIVTPRPGVYLISDLYDQTSPPSENLTGVEFVGETVLSPEMVLDLSYVATRYLFFDGRYRWGQNDETFSTERDDRTSHTGELGLNLVFGFVPVQPLNESSTRTYGRVEAMSDGNLLYAVSQELVLVFLRIDEPDTRVNFSASGFYESSTDPDLGDTLAAAPIGDGTRYFSPDSVLTVKGGLGASSWMGLGDGASLGLSGRAAGGLQIEELGGSDPIRRAQVEGDLNVELGFGATALWAGFQGSRTYRISPSGGSFDDYWSYSLRLGFLARLPRLLAP
jgi:tetratricopeptide (TPR) repeat protein